MTIWYKKYFDVVIPKGCLRRRYSYIFWIVYHYSKRCHGTQMLLRFFSQNLSLESKFTLGGIIVYVTL